LSEGHAIGPRLQEFNLSVNSSKDGLHIHVSPGSVSDRAFGQYGGAAGEGDALEDADDADAINGKNSAFVIGDADPRRARSFAGFRGLLHDLKDGKSREQGQGYGGAMLAGTSLNLLWILAFRMH